MSAKIRYVTVEDIDNLLSDFDFSVSDPVKQMEVSEKKPQSMDFSDKDCFITPEIWKHFTGPVYGWKYWLPEAREWRVTITEAAARRVSGLVKEAWIWYEDGRAVRELYPEEIIEYCP